MNKDLNLIIWNQFGASIDMLENTINACPQKFWDTEKKFWYISYHCLFWLDHYLDDKPSEFHPPTPFTLSEFDSSGLMPERTYSKEELLNYLEHCRNKCFDLLSKMTSEKATSRWTNGYKDYSLTEILLYNMRHVQHHAAQLHLILRQDIDDAPRWVSNAKREMKK